MAGADLHCDVAVVGGGLAGATMAYALRDLGVHCALIEAQSLSVEQSPAFDERAIALAYGSRRIFEGLGLWADIAPHAAPIRHIHISDRGHFGVTHLDAEDYQLDALGYVVTHSALGRAIVARVAQHAEVTLHCPARVSGIALGDDAAVVTLDDQREIRARLVIAADGGQSPLRTLLGIDATRWRYEQTAIVTTVTPQKPHNDVAYERFTSSGPIALLPLDARRVALVMTVADADAQATLAMSDAEYLDHLYQRFGGRLGYFTHATPRRAFPLQMIYATESARHRLALIGNAAHTLHPNAGQGFNLGLRDIAELAQVIGDAKRAGRDFGALDALRRYAQARRNDHRRTIAFTDGLVRVFANDFLPFIAARNGGLFALEHAPGVKRTLSRTTMGLHGPLSRLARGLPL